MKLVHPPNLDRGLLDALPKALTEIQRRHLLVVKIQTPTPFIIGQTPSIYRRVGIVTGGSFESRLDGLNGVVLPNGNDWQTVRGDHATTLDVRVVLQTTAGELIALTYKAIRRGDPDTLARIDRGEAVDPASYYFRSAAAFETGSQRLAWLNGIVAVGTGQRLPDGPVYNIFEVL